MSKAGVQPLGGVKPTQAEVEAAHRILDGSKKKASKMASFVFFLQEQKKLPGANIAEIDEALTSRGSKRQEYFMQWMALSIRQKDAKAISVTTESSSHRTKTMSDVIPMSAEVMDKKVGKDKAEHWRASGKIPWKADSVTGSEDPRFVEWQVPIKWLRMVDEDGQDTNVTVEREADEQDLAALRSARMDSAATSVAQATIKQEELTPEEKNQIAIKDMKDNAIPNARKVQDYIRDIKSILNACKQSTIRQYCTNLEEEANKHLTRLTKLGKTLDMLAVGETCNEAGLPKLLETLDAVVAKHEEITDFGCRMQVFKKATKRKASRLS